MKVAVLDTGFDLGHPDFVGRDVTALSFVAGESAQDGHGHGTHCIGTSCGPRMPSTGPRYGVAHEADIFAGKVLSNSGSGTDAGILAGINWAVANRCPVISMSLGAPVPQAHPPYSAAGHRALQRGSLIIVAAGNNADRRAGNFGFVGAPANSVEIMAVGALDMPLGMAYFSARSLPGRGGRSTSPGRAGRSTRRGRCPRGTGPSAAPAWPRRTWPGWPRSGRRRPAAVASRSGQLCARRASGSCSRHSTSERGSRWHPSGARSGRNVSGMVQLSVTVDDGHLPAINEIAQALRAQGMRVEQVLDGLGIITGSAPADSRPALTGVEGVVSVDEELTHQLPPPDSAVQ